MLKKEWMRQAEEYARLVVRIGVNVQPGQEIVVRCPVEHYEFARLVIKECYMAGAKEVIMRWSDAVESRELIENASEETLAEIPEWKKESLNYYAKRDAGFISIGGSDPEAFLGVDQKKMRIRDRAMNAASREHQRLLTSSAVPWTVAAVPQPAWAKKMFPELSEDAAMDALWEKILTSVRIGGGDVVKAWEEHDRFLKEKCAWLNRMQFTKLEYKNSMGTDFTVGLVKNHIWEGGSEVSGHKKTVFEANLPTEEIFTMPDRMVAEGTLVASMPLSARGRLIKDFSISFHEGRVCGFTAAEGGDVLQSILDTDEGALRLGECALVPYNSPISQMHTLFYSTLFDENAACHFALGACYPTTIEGGENLSEEELLAKGGNSSETHVDFMVGTADLTITGITESGERVTVFENGNWKN